MSFKHIFTRVLICVVALYNGLLSGQQTPPPPYSGAQVTNAVRTWNARKPIQLESDIVSSSRTAQEVLQVTNYTDGLGRSLQTVSKQTSSLGNDQVTANVYDPLGREQWKYLPFTSNVATAGDIVNDGNLKTDPFQQQVAFYNSYLNGQSGETNTGPSGANWAYAQLSFENSPLNRVKSSYSPGANWVGSQAGGTPHLSSQLGLANTPTDNVQIWNISLTSGSLPLDGGAYTAGQLYKKVMTDEQGRQTIEYRDQYGQMILKKVQNTAASDNGLGSAHAGWLCTYYIYDDNGNLRFIIPPAVVSLIDGAWSVSQTLADELCYRYEYDVLNRLITKKLPGTASGATGEIWMVYDVRDRLVMTQDGNMRAGGQWFCHLYDNQDREVMTGFISSANTMSQMQSLVTGQTGGNVLGTLAAGNNVPAGVSVGAASSIIIHNNPLPNGVGFVPQTTSFYDNYSWLSASGTTLSSTLDQTYTSNATYFLTSLNSAPTYAAAITQSYLIQGFVTGEMVQIQGSPGSYLYALNIYDDHGRIIQTQSTNITGGKDIATHQFDWNGKMLRSLVAHNKAGSNTQQHLISGAFAYDAQERLLSITRGLSTTINGTTINSSVQVIAANQYDELNRLQKKTLGNNIDSRTYDYNVRGWLLGVNRAYAKSTTSNSNYFGFDLGYDKGNILDNGSSIGAYGAPVFNGNVAGTVWKSRGDNQIRKYDYGYDVPGRLVSADFNQKGSSQFDKTAGLDFSVSNIQYDPNGNLLSMTQKGWILGGSQSIDDLHYHYINGNGNSNRLVYMEDNSPYNASNPNSMIGDLHYSGTKTTASTDYGYDANGNITSDANRKISSITYNNLNLPQLVTIPGRGTIQYIYDGAGNKLRKVAIETGITVTYNGSSYLTDATTTTTYIHGFIYKSLSYSTSALASLQYTDRLQFAGHEEGRIRALYNGTGSTATLSSYVFDYFLRDHQGNVRMVLTDEQQQDIYPAATVETSTVATEQVYYNIVNDAAHVIATSSLPSWWSSVTGNNYADNNGISNPGNPNPTATSAQLYKLNGQTGDRYGMGITLKVMAGDQISVFGKSVWHNSGTTVSPFPLSGVVSSFLTAIAGSSPVMSGTHGAVTGAMLNSSEGTAVASAMNGTPGQPNPTVAPKAAINWILFNDQFVPVSIGSDLVNSTGDIVKSHSILNIAMPANGYLYVYCSNESNLDVYFDNLQVVNTRGPILEETHYYPFGLTMAGISDRAWNKLPNYFKFNGNELQAQEFSDGTGLEEYDFNARTYDPQIGRFTQPDPLALSGGQEGLAHISSARIIQPLLMIPTANAPGVSL